MLRIAKVNVISLVPHDYSPCVSWTALIVCNFDLGLRCTAFVCFFVGLNRQGTDTCGRTGFASECQERLLTCCHSSCLHRSLQTSSSQRVGPLVLSSTAGFSFLNRLCVACDVPTGESDLVTVSCGRSQRPVLHDLAVNSMSLALALTISFDAFRDFVHGMRTCQWPLSVTSVPLEAVCFVICSASARLRGTDVSDH